MDTTGGYTELQTDPMPGSNHLAPDEGRPSLGRCIPYTSWKKTRFLGLRSRDSWHAAVRRTLREPILARVGSTRGLCSGWRGVQKVVGVPKLPRYPGLLHRRLQKLRLSLSLSEAAHYYAGGDSAAVEPASKMAHHDGAYGGEALIRAAFSTVS